MRTDLSWDPEREPYSLDPSGSELIARMYAEEVLLRAPTFERPFGVGHEWPLHGIGRTPTGEIVNLERPTWAPIAEQSVTGRKLLKLAPA